MQVDQKPIGRTPRSNLATYTGLFDYVRRIFAETKAARARHYTAGRFSFNVAQGRCETCEGEGFVCVELLFMPSVYAPCSTCHGARYNAKTLEIQYRGKNIAEVLAMTVDGASQFFAEQPQVSHALAVLQEVGLGYLRLGQPATELSGGEAQRIKLATELQRNQRGNTLYVLDEPTTGLHPSDVQRLVAQLDGLVELGNTVIVVEHDLDVVAASDYVIDMGPGAGEAGGAVVAYGTPAEVSTSSRSRTALYLKRRLGAEPWPGTRCIQNLTRWLKALYPLRFVLLPCRSSKRRQPLESTASDCCRKHKGAISIGVMITCSVGDAGVRAGVSDCAAPSGNGGGRSSTATCRYKRKQPRPKLNRFDRLFWVVVRRIWTNWSEALILVKPDTVVSWHRAGYRLFWRWRSRPHRVGRPKVAEEVRQLIRRMKRENPRWGAPRIHGELLLLGFEISEPTSVALSATATAEAHSGRKQSRPWLAFSDQPS